MRPGGLPRVLRWIPASFGEKGGHEQDCCTLHGRRKRAIVVICGKDVPRKIFYGELPAPPPLETAAGCVDNVAEQTSAGINLKFSLSERYPVPEHVADGSD